MFPTTPRALQRAATWVVVGARRISNRGSIQQSGRLEVTSSMAETLVPTVWVAPFLSSLSLTRCIQIQSFWLLVLLDLVPTPTHPMRALTSPTLKSSPRPFPTLSEVAAKQD